MNKQELIKNLKDLRDGYPDNDRHNGVRQGLLIAIGAIENLEEPIKVVVPKWFDEWVKGNMFHSDDRGKMLMIKNISQVGWGYTFEIGMSGEVYKPDAGGNLSTYHYEIYNDQDKYIRAVLDGYEVEKEKLYYVIDKSKRPILTIHEGKVVASVSVSKVERAEKLSTSDFKYRLTEKQIKDYDGRYWSFAVEVEE